jgi:hypothetical protein
MFEVFSRRLLLSEQTVRSRDAAREWALRVAYGHRPAMPASWPEELRSLIADCWAQVRGTRGSAQGPPPGQGSWLRAGLCAL